MSNTISINERVFESISQILDRPEKMGCEVLEQKNGTTIIDAGINVSGSDKLGQIIAEISLGGLGAVRPIIMHIEDITVQGVVVSTNEPMIATLCSQYPNWYVNVNDFFAIGSGPAQALSAREKISQEIGYRDLSQRGIIILETDQMPSEEVSDSISKKCGISPSGLYVAIAPFTSIAGSILRSARIIGTGMYKMWKLGFDLSKVRTAHGTAPVAPIAKDNMHAIAMTHDCILYGGRTYYFIRPNENDDLSSLAREISSSSSDQYGKTSYGLLQSINFDLCMISSLLFSPAEVTLNDVLTRETHKAGSLNPDMLRKSLAL